MRRWLGVIVRFIVSALALIIVSYILPGFSIVGFTNAIFAAVAIAFLGYVVEMIFGERISPQNRGIVGFLSSAVVIYVAQYFVNNFNVTIIGAALAAAIIGLIDVFVPTEIR